MNTSQPNNIHIFSRFFFAVGMLLLFPVFFLPLWQIHLEAPQYPEGLTMYIHHNTVTGESEFDLENINLLNHYIGMKKIEPDSIPELSFMKYIIIGLLAFGALTVIVNKKQLMLAWVLVALIISAAGIYDLNRWEEDYGKELDPKAAIKVEGMTYKPPLIGEKQLLNITATSYPHLGGVFFGFSIFLAGLATFMAYKKPGHEDEIGESNNIKSPDEFIEQNSKILSINTTETIGFKKSVLILFLTSAIVSCSVKPRQIKYHTDVCANCSMLISDSKYGTELVTSKGKIYTFDSIECLWWFLDEKKEIPTNEIHALLVTDYANPEKLIDANTSYFIHSDNLPSPMGENLTAFASKEQAQKKHAEIGGEVIQWKEINLSAE